MKIEYKFDYECEEEELAKEFCDHDSMYQSEVLNIIGVKFHRWTEDHAKTAVYVQMLEFAEQLDDYGRWFIKTLAEYAEGGKNSEND